MNRVYKVIWSKAKHCYVVTSEIARSVTKSASSARSAGRKGAAVLAMAALLFTAGGVLGEAANVTDITVNDTGNVITVTKDVGDPTPITIDNVAHAKDADYAKEATKAYSDGDGLVIKNTYAKVDTDGKVAKAVAADSAEQATKDGKGNEISSTYVKIANAKVSTDGICVKVANTVGKNLSALDEQVKKNTMAVVEVGETAGKTFTDLYAKVQTNADAVAAEETARKQADQNNLKIDGDGVVSMVKDDSKPAVDKLVLNKDDKNQITLSKDGIKVGLNSGVMDKDGFYAGGDTADEAKAALKADGSIKGADGKFTVDKYGNADIGGDLTVDKNLTVNGTFDSKTLSSTVDAKDDYTTINGGNVTSEVNDKVGAVEYTAESIFNKDGSSITVRTDEGIVDSTGKSIVGAKEISQYLGDNAKPDGSQKNVTRKMIRNNDGTFSMEDKAVDEGKSSTVSQNAEERKVTVIDGNNKASTNLSNKGFNTYASDGKNKTYTKQTATDIKNTAKNGMISNTAKNLVNTASENMTNTVGKDLTTTVGGNKSETVTGTSTETVTGKKTENYNGGLETTVTGEEKHTVNGSQINAITGSQTNTIGGGQTTTVTGDSSLKAENITNEAKNKITNKAIDVETDATSSIVQKVTNDAGSNTSTQWSYQTLEEMSQADGKTASYLRGAVEEKSQLTDGDKKTTIDTVAGQTNTNITDGTNTSNDLQKADQIASSVTDGTNTTVVNQDAKSLASSITDGAKANNTNNTVDKSEQLIKVDDTHFYAETRTAEKAEEALKSGNTVIDIVKDTNTATVSSAVTDGATITGISQNAKDISLSAAGGTITNDAKDVLNKGTNSVINEVGANQVAVMTDSVKAAYGSDTYTTWDDKGITSNTSGNMSNTVGGDLINTVTGDSSLSATNIKNKASTSITSQIGEDGKVKSEMNAEGISNTAEDGTITNDAKTVKTITGNNTVTSKTEGTTFVNTGANAALKKGNEQGSRTETRIFGNQVETGKVETDFADVNNNLTVGGSTTLGRDGNTNLTVNSKSEFKDTVKMDSTLEVDGESTFNDKVTITKGGLDVVKGGTTTDTLTVTGTSEFGGKAAFKDDVSMGKNLTVTGKTETGILHVNGDGYVGGNLNVEGNIETHDAVLSADSRQVVTGRQLYQTNERVDRLDNRIKKVGANAAALAALRPGDFNPDDKFSIAAGFGSYRNANAAALGLFYRPNENVLLSLGTSFGDGENMVNAGVSVKFGRGKSMAERRKEMADEVSSMRDEMRSQDERIAELEEMLKKQSELIEKLSKES